MSWEPELFAFLDDLEHQAEDLYDAEREIELSDRSRAEYHHVTLASRLMAGVGQEVVLELSGVGPVAGALDRVGEGWCLVRGPAQDWMVPHHAIAAVHLASDRSVPEVAWSPLARLGLGSALRRLADAGQRCVLHRRDGSTHEVVILRVGADFVEARAARGLPVLVAFEALAAVQSRA